MSPIRLPARRRAAGPFAALGASLLAAAALLAAPPLLAQAPAVTKDGPAAPPAAAPVAFENVTVLPMDGSARTVAGQTVVERDGRIAWVGPAAGAPLPANAVRVDGRGKFLMPGLAEMHAHVPPQQNVTEQALEELMFLYVANGVTTIRGMLGAPYQLPLRERLAKGELLGPTFYVAAPSLNGNSAPNAETAERLVRQYKEQGYDLLKLHPGLSREAYDAMVRTAREVNIPFGGHISAGVGLARTLEARQASIDHLDGYFEALIPEAMQARMQGGQAPMAEAFLSVKPTDADLRRLAAQTKAAGVYNVPTAFLWESLYGPDDPGAGDRPEMKYVSKPQVDGWLTMKRNRLAQDAQNGLTPEAIANYLGVRRRVLKALADEGAPLLMGTDSPQLFSVPGFALHREVALMAEVGIPAYTVLESGTANVARYAKATMGMPDDFGTVAVGKRADLLLLDANPLDDVRNLSRRAGVMVKGRWVPASEIEAGLARIAARHAR